MRRIVLCVVGMLFMAVFAEAAPPIITKQVTPGTMSYQGRLQTNTGADYTNGVYTVDFKLYDAGTAGTLLWGATYKPYVNNGFFTVILGQTGVGETGNASATYPTVEDFWKGVWIDPNGSSKQRYLGITVNEDENNATVPSPAESFPRQELQAAPFAIQAQFAQQAVEADHADLADGCESTFEAAGITRSGNSLQVGAGATYVDILAPLICYQDVRVDGLRKLSIGTLQTLAGKIPAGEPETSDLVVGNDVFVDERAYIGDDILLRDKLVMNYNEPDEHVIEHIVEAPAAGVRVVAGRVSHDAIEYADLGDQYTVARYTPINAVGAYKITFTPAFDNHPFVVVCGGSGGNAPDNFWAVESVFPDCAYIVSKDDDHSAGADYQDAAFNFIAIGN
ncbi:MAG: hypothetical protein KAI74_03895 [Kiritimatiellae bacterium]|nr:hypothetical protein [Kiritimatiellia bacterium]